MQMQSWIPSKGDAEPSHLGYEAQQLDSLILQWRWWFLLVPFCIKTLLLQKGSWEIWMRFFLTSYHKGHYVAISNMNHTFISQVPTKMNEPFEAACFSELAVTQDDFTPLNSQGAVRHDHNPVIISGKYVNASWPAPSLCTMFTKISTMYSGVEGGSFFFFMIPEF